MVAWLDLLVSSKALLVSPCQTPFELNQVFELQNERPSDLHGI